MTKERELLRRALEDWDFSDKFETLDPIFEEIRTYLSTPSDDAEGPVAWMFQHEDTGLIDFVDTQQVEWGFEKNNPRWQKIGPVYLHPPKPEPEANCYGDGNVYRGVRSKDSEVKTVYVKTAEPARKPWQGLDEDEVEEILEGFPMGTYSEQAFAQAIEQELKERNT